MAKQKPVPRQTDPLQPLEKSPDAVAGHGPADLGIALGGGGARAAYQVGFLRCVARLFPDLYVPYVTGVSAGSINAAHLASHHGRFIQAVDELTHLWSNLTVEDVFHAGSLSLALNMWRWGTQLVSGGNRVGDGVRSLVDAQPLRAYLEDHLHTVDGEMTGIEFNVRTGRLKAAAITTSSYTTGQSVTWVQGKDIKMWERPQRRAHNTVLSVDHVMASTAIPFFFPAVRLQDGWHGDGSLRLTAPLSPTLHLGAQRIMAISTRYAPTDAEADRPEVTGYPPPAQVAGVVMNSVFLDLLDNDALELERLNVLLAALPKERRHGLRPLRLFVLRPTEDLGRMAYDYELRLPRAFRFMTRGLGTLETNSPDLLSFILFQPDYLRALMALGDRDATERADEIRDFLTAEPEE